MIFALTDEILFPPPQLASEDGLLAVGGDLSEERLLLAYSMGIFPWYSEEDPILWWAPDPRLVFELDDLYISKRLARVIRQGVFEVRCDTAFAEVIQACSRKRPGKEEGTWIMPEMVDAYCRLHDLGFAHSVECWREGKLAGGLYGIALGKIFFGESMFSRQDNASKVALFHLVEMLRKWGFELIDCQVKSEHLVRLGAKEIPGLEFRQRLKKYAQIDQNPVKWNTDFGGNSNLY
ncbi:MAG: leucyl/phenylalanyl-tRNA--protein transferase [Desulfobulbaceae bacterium]|uniref:Leucyl/phenylalanyl-tRNA--protein transferase n=1 Tax=Candidatus Desulfobia pelagia TaxID=2841692 RepID=A0A8J6TBJ3_9BACT|nr:leucyl/phenylalanyl-tRNA--protein transferase [Candidatus Desulfobia pelagia]